MKKRHLFIILLVCIPIAVLALPFALALLVTGCDVFWYGLLKLLK
jgi:hypothetical protein